MHARPVAYSARSSPVADHQPGGGADGQAAQRSLSVNFRRAAGTDGRREPRQPVPTKLTSSMKAARGAVAVGPIPSFALSAAATARLRRLRPLPGADARRGRGWRPTTIKVALAVEQKQPGALTRLKVIADGSHAPAQMFLAPGYSQAGVDTEDLAEARRWTARAADAGDPTAMHNLSLTTISTRGGPQICASGGDLAKEGRQRLRWWICITAPATATVGLRRARAISSQPQVVHHRRQFRAMAKPTPAPPWSWRRNLRPAARGGKRFPGFQEPAGAAHSRRARPGASGPSTSPPRRSLAGSATKGSSGRQQLAHLATELAVHFYQRDQAWQPPARSIHCPVFPALRLPAGDRPPGPGLAQARRRLDLPPAHRRGCPVDAPLAGGASGAPGGFHLRGRREACSGIGGGLLLFIGAGARIPWACHRPSPLASVMNHVAHLVDVTASSPIGTNGPDGAFPHGRRRPA
jgi:hypothetical protein